jgi:hypothetical protein
MLYAYTARFDVMFWGEFLGTKHPLTKEEMALKRRNGL